MRLVVFLSFFVLVWGDHDGRWKKHTPFKTQQECFDAGLVTEEAGFKVYRCKYVGS